MLLIIGNGFDINLGLKTRYSDYLESVKNNHSFNGTELYKHLCEAYRNSGLNSEYRWVDIENELKNYVIKKLATATTESNLDIKQFSKKFREHFQWLTEGIQTYINQAANFANIKDSHAKDYIKKLAERLAHLHSSSRNVPENNILEILSFNYTTNRTVKLLLEECFGELNSEQLLDATTYHQVHGSLETNNIVLGVEGKANLETDFNFIKKGLQEHYPSMVDVETLLTKHNEIHFYGFSLGETDAPYFRDFFSVYSSPGTNSLAADKLAKKLFFYYHEQSGYDQIITRIDELTDKNVDRLRQRNDVKFISIQNYIANSFTSDYFKF